jgi:predicted transcriptional regulator YheO
MCCNDDIFSKEDGLLSFAKLHRCVYRLIAMLCVNIACSKFSRLRNPLATWYDFTVSNPPQLTTFKCAKD